MSTCERLLFVCEGNRGKSDRLELKKRSAAEQADSFVIPSQIVDYVTMSLQRWQNESSQGGLRRRFLHGTEIQRERRQEDHEDANREKDEVARVTYKRLRQAGKDAQTENRTSSVIGANVFEGLQEA